MVLGLLIVTPDDGKAVTSTKIKGALYYDVVLYKEFCNLFFFIFVVYILLDISQVTHNSPVFIIQAKLNHAIMIYTINVYFIFSLN